MKARTCSTPRAFVTLIAFSIVFTPARLHATTFNSSITFTETLTAATYGAWTRYVDGLDVSVEVKGIGVGSTLWPDGGLACRSCSQQVRDVTCVRCFNSRWDRFWWKVENSTLLSWNTAAPRTDSSTQTKVCCGAPSPNLIDGSSGQCLAEVTSLLPAAQPLSYTVVTLYMDLHSSLRFNAATLPLPEDNTISAYIDDVALRYFAGAAKWNEGANVAASMSGEEPRAGQMASILFGLASEMNRIANNLAGPGVLPGDFFQTRQLTDQLRTLYMSDPSSVPTELALRTQEQVAILSEIDALTTAGVDSFEVLAFIDALERYNSWSFYNVAAGVQYKERSVGVDPRDVSDDVSDVATLVTVHPNPSSEVFRFRVEFARPVNAAALEIVDMSGRIVEKVHRAQSASQLWECTWRASRDLPGGVYAYRLSSGHMLKNGKLTLLR